MGTNLYTASNDAFYQKFTAAVADFESESDLITAEWLEGDGDDFTDPQNQALDQYWQQCKVATLVDEGGGEGGGESVIRVYHFKNPDTNEEFFIETTGSYYSGNGTDWDSGHTRVYPHKVEAVMFTRDVNPPAITEIRYIS